ncbi:norbelladine synthase-like [Cornus florida]|uniref:norbelladine synthase-like n=1 Tax=Cornus florida TaxID=4283 RepID=UPI0028A0AD4B|nr:norbelladine synthase-like [Cornus florida]
MNKVGTAEYTKGKITTHQQEKKMFGSVSEEIEVQVSANEAWQIYGTLRLLKIVQEELSDFIHKVEIVEGDGSVGTVIEITFPPGTPGFTSYREKFTKIDNENRVKEATATEGGYLNLGFTLYRGRFEVIEKSENSCITKCTVEYEIKEEAAANVSMISTEALMKVMEAVANYLVKNKK